MTGAEAPIIPWRCHICGDEFHELDGGICARCKKATCLSHLHSLKTPDRKAKGTEKEYICKACRSLEPCEGSH